MAVIGVLMDNIDMHDDSSMPQDKSAAATITKREVMQLRSKAHVLDAMVRIGKNGINDNVIIEINNLLRKRRLIKIKVLKNSLENNELDKLIDEVVLKTKSNLVERIGLTFTIYR
jgi:RNA-binding protein